MTPYESRSTGDDNPQSPSSDSDGDSPGLGAECSGGALVVVVVVAVAVDDGGCESAGLVRCDSRESWLEYEEC